MVPVVQVVPVVPVVQRPGAREDLGLSAGAGRGGSKAGHRVCAGPQERAGRMGHLTAASTGADLPVATSRVGRGAGGAKEEGRVACRPWDETFEPYW